MKSHNAAIGLLVIVVIILSSCKKDKDPINPVQLGQISGQLRLYDEFGVQLSESSNMQITALGAGAALSQTDGSYLVGNLPSGKYDLVYEKTGYGTYKRFSIEVVAGANATILNGIDNLGQKSTTAISNLSVVVNAVDTTADIGCDLSPVPVAGSPRAFRLFYGKTNLVTGQDYFYAPSTSWVATTPSVLITGIDLTQFYNNGFSSGEMVYVIAYGESFHTNTYVDQATGKKVFPNINSSSPSNVVSFMLP